MLTQRQPHFGGQAPFVLLGQRGQPVVLFPVDVGAHRDPFRGRGFLLTHGSPSRWKNCKNRVPLLDGCQAHLFNYGQVAKSLQEARREAAERTAQGIASCERDGLFGDEIAEDHPEWVRLVDRKALRGVPCAGRGVGGAIAGSQPGTGPLFDDDA